MIGILGYYNRASRGDDLLQFAMQKLFGETHVFTVSSPKEPSPIPLEQVNGLDALIVGGGTLLGQALPYPLCDPQWIEGVEAPLYVFGAGAKFLHRNGELSPACLSAPASLSAQAGADRGKGRLTDASAQAHHALRLKAQYFGVRGPLTQAGLAREEITSDILGDPLLALSPSEPSVFFDSPPWLVNFRHPAWFGYGGYGEAAQQVVNTLGQRVSLFPLAFDGDDARFLTSLFGVEVEVPTVAEIVLMVQDCAGVVAMRLHACVLAAVCGKPFLNLGYEMKSWDFQKTVAPILPVPMVPEPPEPEEIMGQWEMLQVHRGFFCGNVMANVAHFREAIQRKAEAILEEVG